MYTAVVGGSIHRTATSMSTASDQRSPTPMRNHRIKIGGSLSEAESWGECLDFQSHFRIYRLGRIDIAPDESRYRKLTHHARATFH